MLGRRIVFTKQEECKPMSEDSVPDKTFMFVTSVTRDDTPIKVSSVTETEAEGALVYATANSIKQMVKHVWEAKGIFFANLDVVLLTLAAISIEKQYGCYSLYAKHPPS